MVMASMLDESSTIAYNSIIYIYIIYMSTSTDVGIM